MTEMAIGTDIIEIERIEKAIARYGSRFLDKIFTARERQYCSRYKKSAAHYAGKFAAKEAVSKALRTGIGKELSWLDIEILNNAQGAPNVTLSNRAADLFDAPEIILSISHAKAYATAVALLIYRPKG